MKKLQRNEMSFEKNSLILLILMMMANICNYIFQIITGRMLTVEEYAMENTVLSLFCIFSIPNGIITMISARYLAKAESENERRETIQLLLKIVFAISFIMTVVIIILARYINVMLSTEGVLYVLSTVLYTIIALVYSTSYGILQGMQKIVRMGMQNFFVLFGRCILSVIFIAIGFGVYGVVLALIISTIFAIIYGLFPIFDEIRNSLFFHGDNSVHGLEFIKYSLGVTFAQGIVMAFTNGDILLVKFYFDDNIAGLYSSAMVLGKMAMYVATAIVAAMFPIVVIKKEKGEDTSKIIRKTFWYGGSASFLCTVGLIVFSRYIIPILFGEKYRNAIELLPAVGCYVIPLTFVTILMNCLLALNLKKVFSISMLLSGITCIILTAFFHKTILSIMLCLSFSLILVFFVNMIALSVRIKKNN